MKKLLIFLFSFLISFNSYGLFEKTVCVENDTVKTGGITYLPNETKPFTGKNICEFLNGQFKSKGKYKDGKKDDHWIEWNMTGQILSDLNYKDGKLVGETKYDYHSNGHKFKEIISTNGKKKHTFWHENGQKHIEGNYKDGKEEGEWLYYHENGELQKTRIFKNGEITKSIDH